MTALVETRVFTAHVPLQLAKRIDRFAERTGRTRDWVVKQALAAWIDQEEEHCRLTCEALADVDAGCVIDHQTVQTWAGSLNSNNPLPVPQINASLSNCKEYETYAR